MHVLLAASELHPFSKTGGLADMVGSLAHSLADAGVQISVITPLYRGITSRFPSIKAAQWRFAVRLGNEQFEGQFFRLSPSPELTVWFVQQDSFYDRAGLYSSSGLEYLDNATRFLFLTHAALILARHLPNPPKIIHSHDWQTGLLPLYLQYARAAGDWPTAPQSIFTLHNLAYQGSFPSTDWALTGLPTAWFHLESAQHFQRLNFLKAALTQSTAITTVSPNYAREILTPEYGCGLEGLLIKRANDLTGILNGVDYSEWNTTANPALPASFTSDDLSGKALCKAAVQTRAPCASGFTALHQYHPLDRPKGLGTYPRRSRTTAARRCFFPICPARQWRSSSRTRLQISCDSIPKSSVRAYRL